MSKYQEMAQNRWNYNTIKAAEAVGEEVQMAARKANKQHPATTGIPVDELSGFIQTNLSQYADEAKDDKGIAAVGLYVIGREKDTACEGDGNTDQNHY